MYARNTKKSNNIVHYGPFKGMRRTNKSSHGAVLAEMLGSYEEPIHKWIVEIINKDYQFILDIGCADGYYAAGFAFKKPNTKVYAYDIDQSSRKNTQDNCQLNNLDNVKVLEECTHEELNDKSKPNTLVFSDIEGFEDSLLCPQKVPNLKYVDLLIESHDCFVPDMTEKLINRFCNTHTIDIIVDYPFRLNKYKSLHKCSQEIRDFITHEGKAKNMKFLYLKSVVNYKR